MLLKYYHGKNLYEINHNLLKYSDYALIEIKIAKKLLEIHKKGFIHGDLKPDNIIVNDLYDINIIDYEYSVAKDDTKIKNIGSPLYRAPEISTKNYDERSDIFSFGLIVYFLETGRDPFYTSYDSPVCDQLDFGLIYPSILPYYIRNLTSFNPSERFPLEKFIKLKTIEYNIEISKKPKTYSMPKIDECFNKEIIWLDDLFTFDDLYQMLCNGYGFSYSFFELYNRLTALDIRSFVFLNFTFLFQGYSLGENILMISLSNAMDKDLKYFYFDVISDAFYLIYPFDYVDVANDFHTVLSNEIVKGSIQFYSKYRNIQKPYLYDIFEHLMYVLDDFPSFLVHQNKNIFKGGLKKNVDHVRFYQLLMHSYERNALFDLPFYLLLFFCKEWNGAIEYDFDLKCDLLHMLYYEICKPFETMYVFNLHSFKKFVNYNCSCKFRISKILKTEAIDLMDYSIFYLSNPCIFYNFIGFSIRYSITGDISYKTKALTCSCEARLLPEISIIVITLLTFIYRNKNIDQYISMIIMIEKISIGCYQKPKINLDYEEQMNDIVNEQNIVEEIKNKLNHLWDLTNMIEDYHIRSINQDMIKIIVSSLSDEEKSSTISYRHQKSAKILSDPLWDRFNGIEFLYLEYPLFHLYMYTVPWVPRQPGPPPETTSIKIFIDSFNE